MEIKLNETPRVEDESATEAPIYERENAFAKCEICNGPIYHGEPMAAYVGTDTEIQQRKNTADEMPVRYVHRFTTYFNFYKEQEKKFVESLGVEL
jgi:hypothetical protein